MGKTNSRTVATRLKFSELAKARDGLLARGISPDQLTTSSNILRLCVYLTILNCNDPKAPASQESQDLIKQLWKQTKLTKNITIDELTDE